MEITTFLVHSEQHGLIRVIHTIVDLKRVTSNVKWSKIAVWKNNQRQNILLSYLGNEEMLRFSQLYV